MDGGDADAAYAFELHGNLGDDDGHVHSSDENGLWYARPRVTTCRICYPYRPHLCRLVWRAAKMSIRTKVRRWFPVGIRSVFVELDAVY